MLLAAYVVAGFAVAGVYAVGMLRGRRDRYHRIGLLVPLVVGAIAIPLQIFMGDVIARAVFHDEPAKFAAIEALPKTGTHVPEELGGVMIDGKLRFSIPIPDGASLLSGFSPSTRIAGLDAIPAKVRPPDHLVTIVHLSFDIMVGTGFLLLGLALWFALAWWRHRVMRPSVWFLRAVAVSGLVAIVSLETGWVVTEVGRQPWTVVGLLLTRDAVQTSGNLWPFFGGAVVIYAGGHGRPRCSTLRGLRRRWAAGQDVATPYGPEDEPAPVGDGAVSTLVALVLLLGAVLYGVFGGADFGAGLWDLTAGGAQRGKRPRELIDHAIGPVWEANHTWLIFCLVVLWSGFPTAFAAIMTTQYIPLGIAAFGIVLRGSGFAFRKVSIRTAEQRRVRRGVRAVVDPYPVLLRCGGRRNRVRTGADGRARRSDHQLAQPHLGAGRSCSRCSPAATWPPCS